LAFSRPAKPEGRIEVGPGSREGDLRVHTELGADCSNKFGGEAPWEEGYLISMMEINKDDPDF